LIINTTEGKQAIADSYTLRRSALQHHVAYTTTIAGATAAVMALAYTGKETTRRLQSLHQEFANE
jgi:carbamoyl-phosphate synthase large subunit